MTTEVRFFGGRYSVEYGGALDIRIEGDKVRFEAECKVKFLGLDIPGWRSKPEPTLYWPPYITFEQGSWSGGPSKPMEVGQGVPVHKVGCPAKSYSNARCTCSDPEPVEIVLRRIEQSLNRILVRLGDSSL